MLPQPSAIVYSYMFAYGGCPAAAQRNASESVSAANISQLAPVAKGPSHAGGSLLEAMVMLVPAVVSAVRYVTRGQSGSARYAADVTMASAYAAMKKS